MKRLLLFISLFLGLSIYAMDDNITIDNITWTSGNDIELNTSLGSSSPSISLPSGSYSHPILSYSPRSTSSKSHVVQKSEATSSSSMSTSVPKKQSRVHSPTPINPDDFFRRSLFTANERNSVSSNQLSQNVDTSHLFKKSLFTQNSTVSKSEPKIDTSHLFKRSLFDQGNTSNASNQAIQSNDRVHARSYTFHKQSIPNRYISANELLSVEGAKPALIRHPDGNLSTGVVIPTPDSNHSAVYEVGPLNSSALAAALTSSNPSVKPLSNRSDYAKLVVFDLRDGQLTVNQREQSMQDTANHPEPVVNKGITTSKSMQEGLNLKAREEAERTQAFRARVQKENQDFIKDQLKQGRDALWDRELQKRFGVFPDRYGNEYPGIKQWDGRVIIGNMNNRTRWIDNDGYIHTARESDPNFQGYEDNAAQERYEAQRQERINTQFNRFWSGARSHIQANKMARNLAQKCDNYSPRQLHQAVQKLDSRIKTLEDNQKTSSFKLAVCRSLRTRLSRRIGSDQIRSDSANQVTTSPQVNDDIVSHNFSSNNDTVSFEQSSEEQPPPLPHREVIDNDPLNESDHDEDSNDHYGFDSWVPSPIKTGARAVDTAMDWTSDRVVDVVEWLTGNEDVGAVAEGLLNLPKRPVHLFTRPLETVEGFINLGRGLGKVFVEAIHMSAYQEVFDIGFRMGNQELMQEGLSHFNEQQERFDQAYKVFDEIDRRQKISGIAEIAGGIFLGTSQGHVAQAKVIGAGKKLFGHAKKLDKRVYHPGFRGPKPRVIAVAEGAAEEMAAVLNPQPGTQRPSMHMRNNPQKTRAPRRSRPRANKPKPQKPSKSSLQPAEQASSSQDWSNNKAYQKTRAKAAAKNARVKDPKIEWASHYTKHRPPKNVPWKELVKSTKHRKAFYKHGVNIKEIELFAWQHGTKVNIPGKNWKVYKFNKIIGANSGKETCYIRIECSANVVHGHPITESRYLGYLK